MLRRNIADRLYTVVMKRFADELPNRKLTKNDMDGIWYTIYGKLCRGEPESDVEKWCKEVSLQDA